jgi:hypothetical protein
MNTRDTSNLTVSSNKINVPVLNGSVSGVHCLLLIVCQGTHILPFNTGALILLELTVRLDALVIQNMSILTNNME